MNTKTTRGRSQDRARVAAGQDYEVNYEKDKMKTGSNEIKKAIKQEGNSRKKIEKNLKTKD